MFGKKARMFVLFRYCSVCNRTKYLLAFCDKHAQVQRMKLVYIVLSIYIF